ncbi:MAG TPA: methyltransferase domain-containing protein [Ruminiclostridium sp.]|nr:methyltransferase domain-containing protein [Ruminiclostridium sp.]
MEKLLSMLTEYKKTCALLAGIKLGVLSKLSQKKLSLNELSQSISADPEMLLLLLIYFSSEGVVECTEGLWSITEDFAIDEKMQYDFENITEHEENIYRQWNTPENIADAVTQGLKHRAFDLQGFPPDSLVKYNRAMYGSNVKVISFWINRYIRHIKNISFLEFGRSPGVLASSLKLQGADIKADVAVFDNLYDSTCQKLENTDICLYKLDGFKDFKKYNVIAMFNTVHYYSKKDLEKVLRSFHAELEDEAVLCIADIFHKEDSRFKSGVLVDWITHGGTSFIFMEELTELLNETGFTISNIKNLPEISIDLIICSVKREKEVGKC